MTDRERFLRIMSFERPDRIPAVEYAPFWGETLDRWHSEGLDPAVPPERLKSLLGADDMYEYVLLWPRTASFPETAYGRGAVEGPGDYDRLMGAVYPGDIRRTGAANIDSLAAAQAEGSKAAGAVLYGFFWWPRELFGMQGLCYALYDQPDFIRRMNGDLLRYNRHAMDELCKAFVPDFVVISEDMCGKNGPLISRAMFNEFMLPYYRELMPCLKARGIKVFLDTDGFCEPMLDWAVEAGYDGISPCERNAGVDPARIRERYPRLLMVGGVDKRCMSRGDGAVRAELRHLQPVMRSGGYLPSCDHQTPPQVSLAQYGRYMEILREFCRDV